LTVDDLTLLTGAPARVFLLLGEKHQHVYVYSAYVPFPYVNANLRTPAKVEQAVVAQSTIHYYDGSHHADPTTVDIDGLIMPPSLTGLNKGSRRKNELFHFGVLAQWLFFRGAVMSRHTYIHQDISLPMRTFFHPRFTAADFGQSMCGF
jgi:hypothetical protein